MSLLVLITELPGWWNGRHAGLINLSQQLGNYCWEPVKFGEPFSTEVDGNAEPSLGYTKKV